jgi:hypothetical protein
VEGRAYSVSVSSGQGPLTSTAYNGFGKAATLNFGSLDSENFAYDPNTGRMTQYKYNVNGSSLIGNLTWNANSTLKQLAMTDPFNAANGQTCNNSYDASRWCFREIQLHGNHYMHPDWLGTVRLLSTTSRSADADMAFSPFGHPYIGAGFDSFFIELLRLRD